MSIPTICPYLQNSCHNPATHFVWCPSSTPVELSSPTSSSPTCVTPASVARCRPSVPPDNHGVFQSQCENSVPRVCVYGRVKGGYHSTGACKRRWTTSSWSGCKTSRQGRYSNRKRHSRSIWRRVFGQQAAQLTAEETEMQRHYQPEHIFTIKCPNPPAGRPYSWIKTSTRDLRWSATSAATSAAGGAKRTAGRQTDNGVNLFAPRGRSTQSLFLDAHKAVRQAGVDKYYPLYNVYSIYSSCNLNVFAFF